MLHSVQHLFLSTESPSLPCKVMENTRKRCIIPRKEEEDLSYVSSVLRMGPSTHTAIQLDGLDLHFTSTAQAAGKCLL